MSAHHVSTLTLHRLRYGDLDAAAAEQVRSHLAACRPCAARLREQEQERAAFVAMPVPEALVRAGRRPGPWFELRGLMLALATSAAVFAIVPQLRADRGADRVQARGLLPEIEAWVEGTNGPRPLRPGEKLSAGHRVNLAYDPHGASSVAIAGRDGTGTVEVYTTNAPTGVGLVRAPFALALDDTPGTQELFVVTSGAPLDEGAVVRAVEQNAPEDVQVARIAIEKTSP